MSPSRPSIVIVGGGIGGLFAANALIAQGLQVSVYEQAPALGEVGAGVYITPNCVRQLQPGIFIRTAPRSRMSR
jgi:salicylate hydroxylase